MMLLCVESLAMNDLQKRIEKWVEKMMPLIGIARYEDEHGDKEASEAIMAAYGYAEELRKEIKRLAKVESLKAAEIERLKGGIASVKKLHTRYGLYQECEHDCYEDEPEHHAGKSPVHIEDIGYTCAEPQWVCYYCDTDGGEPNEVSEYGKYPCETLAALTVRLEKVTGND